jgi:D-xylose transport system substrate-binding protein
VAQLVLLVLSIALSGCGKEAAAPAAAGAVPVESASAAATTRAAAARPRHDGPVRIGFSMDTLAEERWQRDRQFVEMRAQQLGATIDVQVANGDDALQKRQCDAMLANGVDVLIVVPHNAALAATIVETAHRKGVPVVSYDRLIRNADVDLYVSHQVPRIGAMQAEYALKRVPKGNYLLIGGAPNDNNALLLRKAQMTVLQPAIDRGDIKVVAQPYATEWRPEEARRITARELERTGGDIQAVVASNDGTAGGAVEALQAAGLAGKVVVTGQDGDLEAARRIARGTQAMTVFKPIQALAFSAVEAAMRLARNEPVTAPELINNGKGDIRAILLEPVVVDRATLDATMIQGGYHRREDVYP